MKKPVTFKNNTLNMAGMLNLPEEFDESKKYAAIVCVHPGGGVKEQTAGLYAQKLSEQGFITLAFDASHQGESEGEPRFLESPTARVEDIRCAVDYLTTLPYVNAGQIGALGICAGGGYVLNSAQTEKRIKAVAGVSAVDIGALFRGDGQEGSVQATLETLKAVAAQRTAEANGAEPMYVTWTPNSLEEITEDMPVLFKEAYDYYRTPRGQHPTSTNQVLFTSFGKILGFSAFNLLDTLLTQPMLVIAGSEADTLIYSQQAYEMSNGPKEIFTVEGATHVDMYDKPEYVKPAVDKLTEFFNTNLQ